MITAQDTNFLEALLSNATVSEILEAMVKIETNTKARLLRIVGAEGAEMSEHLMDQYRLSVEAAGDRADLLTNLLRFARPNTLLSTAGPQLPANTQLSL